MTTANIFFCIFGVLTFLYFLVSSNSALSVRLPIAFNKFRLHHRNNKLTSSTTVLAVLSFNLIGLGYPANAAVVLLDESRDVNASASATV